jgi:hypothetical protein
MRIFVAPISDFSPNCCLLGTFECFLENSLLIIQIFYSKDIVLKPLIRFMFLVGWLVGY